MADVVTTVQCWICAKPIPLEDCKTDDDGHPVHEDCYCEQTVERQTAAGTEP
jgi:hypothetical protein